MDVVGVRPRSKRLSAETAWPKRCDDALGTGELPRHSRLLMEEQKRVATQHAKANVDLVLRDDSDSGALSGRTEASQPIVGRCRRCAFVPFSVMTARLSGRRSTPETLFSRRPSKRLRRVKRVKRVKRSLFSYDARRSHTPALQQPPLINCFGSFNQLLRICLDAFPLLLTPHRLLWPC